MNYELVIDELTTEREATQQEWASIDEQVTKLLARRHELSEDLTEIDRTIEFLRRRAPAQKAIDTFLAGATGHWENYNQPVEILVVSHTKEEIARIAARVEEPGPIAELVVSEEPNVPMKRYKRRIASQPLTDAIRQNILRVIRRLGRFCYRDDIANELLRDGIDYGDDLRPHLATMVSEGAIAKARFNGTNRCIAYGVAEWVATDKRGWRRVDGEAVLPIGQTIDPESAEIEYYG